MNRKKTNKYGMSLPEISLAVLIFALCAIPLYYAISYGSAEEIHLEKRALGNKILESFRDEIKNMDYDTAVQEYGNISDNSQLPPETFKNIVDNAATYKDYKFKSEHEVNPGNIESVTFKATVTWTSGNGQEVEQKISFVKVK